MRSSKAMSATDSGLVSPDFTSFQSICISVDFIWAEFLFKPSPGALRALRRIVCRITTPEKSG
jgi:hypothetical protein